MTFRSKVGIGTPLSKGGAVRNCIGTSGRGRASSWRPADESLQNDSGIVARRRSEIMPIKICSKVVASRRRAVFKEESVLCWRHEDLTSHPG